MATYHQGWCIIFQRDCRLLIGFSLECAISQPLIFIQLNIAMSPPKKEILSLSLRLIDSAYQGFAIVKYTLMMVYGDKVFLILIICTVNCLIPSKRTWTLRDFCHVLLIHFPNIKQLPDDNLSVSVIFARVRLAIRLIMTWLKTVSWLWCMLE